MAAFGSTNATPLLQTSDSDNEEATPMQQSEGFSDDKPLFKPPEPKDKYSLAFFIFYFIGMTTLLPWNFFITADDYWMYKFRDVNKNDTSNVTKRTALQAEFTSYINLASALPTVVFLVINTVITQKISVQTRMLGSLILMLLLFILTTVFINLNTDAWQQPFFVLTLVTVIILSVASAILSGSLFGIVGKFSPKYITAVVGGQALGGIFTAIVEILSLAIGASSVHSAFVYFTIGNLTIAICIVSYVVLTKSVFYKFHFYEKALIPNEFENVMVRPQIICYTGILGKIWTYGLTEFLVFGITLAVYPGVTVLIESEGKENGHAWANTYFVPTINYLLFNAGDFLGRLIAGKLQKPKHGKLQLFLVSLRIIGIPLLMLCNAQPRHNLPVLFDKDYIYIILMIIFSISNGYFANLAAICAPRVVEQHEREIASSMVMVFLGVGLGIGACVGLLLVKII